MRMGFVEGIDRLGRLIWEVLNLKGVMDVGSWKAGYNFGT